MQGISNNQNNGIFSSRENTTLFTSLEATHSRPMGLTDGSGLQDSLSEAVLAIATTYCNYVL
jgi:hypothetical protein